MGEKTRERGIKGTRGKACSRKVERRRHPEGAAKYTYYVPHGQTSVKGTHSGLKSRKLVQLLSFKKTSARANGRTTTRCVSWYHSISIDPEEGTLQATNERPRRPPTAVYAPRHRIFARRRLLLFLRVVRVSYRPRPATGEHRYSVRTSPGTTPAWTAVRLGHSRFDAAAAGSNDDVLQADLRPLPPPPPPEAAAAARARQG